MGGRDMADNKNIKSRCHAIMLYPDNPYHVELLEYLKKTYDGFYICHDSGSDNFSIPRPGYIASQHDEKKHLHVVIQFKNPRTSSGFIKSLPTVRYYKPLQLNNYDEKFKQRLFTVYDLSYLDISLQEIIQPIISHTEVISDIYAYSHYLLHKDFKSVMLGKKEYSFNDVQPLCSSVEHYSDYFMQTDNNDSEMLDQIVQIWSCCDGSLNMFIQLCSMHSNKLVKYVQSHSYFIDKFIVNNKEVNVYD